MSDLRRIPWKPLTPLESADVPTNGSFAALDALRAEWERYLKDLGDAEQTKIRQRSLRRLAVETGILERLYDIDWGLTLTLVAEGFTRDVVERAAGHLDDRTRSTLEAQRESLQMVLDFVSTGRNLSASFIKELHAALTRTQLTYEAIDTLGRSVDAPLEHGMWKTQPNHVERSDGTLLEYAPPEQVQSEIDHLISLHEEHESKRYHPIVLAAWLHHRFVQIHPFSDGNGRVARALVLLVLQKHRYAPLVVDRFHRNEYLASLDVANAGDIQPLVKLFVRLESAALTSELEAPAKESVRGLSEEVAHTLAAQLHAARQRKQTAIDKALHARAINLSARIAKWFDRKAGELKTTFDEQGLKDAQVDFFEPKADSEQRHWFRHQIVSAARTAGHFADFGEDAGWFHLRIRLGGVTLRYVAAIHGAGRRSGVLAVVTFGELLSMTETSLAELGSEPQWITSTKDAFRVVHTESIGEIEKRAVELDALLDEGLSEALVQLFRAAQ